MKHLWRKAKKGIAVIVTLCLVVTMMPGIVIKAATNASVSVSTNLSSVNIYTDETVTVNLTVTGKEGVIGSEETEKIIPTDIVLVIDQSGSMGGTNMNALKPAAKSFIDKINFTKHQVGIIGYDSSVVTSVDFSTNADDLKDQINNLQPAGGTSVIPAIKAAVSMLESGKRPEAKPVVILLTDGMASDRNNAAAAAKEAKEKGVIFYTIGMYGEGDAALVSGTSEYEINKTLSDIATSEDHHHFIGVNMLDETLKATYEKIASTIGKDKAQNVVITQELPDEFELVSGSTDKNVPRPTISGKTITWEMLEVLNGSFTLSYQIKPKDGIKSGTYANLKSGSVSYEINGGTKKSATIPSKNIIVKEIKDLEVRGMSPTSGQVGIATKVKIEARNMIYDNEFKVYVGDKEVKVAFKEADSFAIYVPKDLEVGTYDVKVKNRSKEAVIGQYTYTAKPVPTPMPITDFSPKSGDVGEKTKVTVTGNNLSYSGDFKVTVGGKEVKTAFKNAESFNLYVPTDLAKGSYDIIITNEGVETTVGQYTYIEKPKPTATSMPITRFSPTLGRVGVKTKVTVLGNKLLYSGDFKVTVGGKEVKTAFKKEESFSLYVPTDLSVGSYDIVITNGGRETTIGQYTYTGAPTASPMPITDYSPKSGQVGVNTKVTVTGNKLSYSGEFKVTVGGKEVKTAFKKAESFNLYAPTDLGIGSYDIVITNAGRETTIGQYTYTGAPTPSPMPITDYLPKTGQVGVDTKVTVIGNKLSYSGDFKVTVGGKEVKTAFKKEESFSLYVPTDLGVGSHDIVITNNGVKTTIGQYTYTGATTVSPLTITGFSPVSGKKGTKVKITITGVKLSYDKEFTVTLGGTPVKACFMKEDSFVIYAPANLTQGDYQIVVTRGGTQTNVGTYKVVS